MCYVYTKEGHMATTNSLIDSSHIESGSGVVACNGGVKVKVILFLEAHAMSFSYCCVDFQVMCN